jgi:hypothetical protein
MRLNGGDLDRLPPSLSKSPAAAELVSRHAIAIDGTLTGSIKRGVFVLASSARSHVHSERARMLPDHPIRQERRDLREHDQDRDAHHPAAPRPMRSSKAYEVKKVEWR